MSVYVDPIMPCLANKHWTWNHSCHIYADSLDELILFAKNIGLKSTWLQTNTMPHFDLTVNKRLKAIANGAIEHTRKQMVQMMKEKRSQDRLEDAV